MNIKWKQADVRLLSWILALIVLTATGCYDPNASSNAGQKSNYNLVSKFDEQTPHDKDFDPKAAARPQDPITEIPLESVAQVGSKLKDDELVLGVEIAGESRAYPIVQLCGPQREIINDQLGGSSIAATW